MIERSSASRSTVLKTLSICLVKTVLDRVVVELKGQAAQVPEQLSSLSQSDATALRKQLVELKASQEAQNAAVAQRYSDIEERLMRSQSELNQVTVFLDGAREMNTLLQSKLDMEKKNHEDEIQKLKDEIQDLTRSRDNLKGLYKHATDSLSTLERSHKFTLEDLQKKRTELEESQDELLRLGESLSSKESTIKDLCASKKILSQELDIAKHNIGVLESDRAILKSTCDKAMDKAIRVGRLLMKRPGVVVPKDILSVIPSASESTAKTPSPGEPKAGSA